MYSAFRGFYNFVLIDK